MLSVQEIQRIQVLLDNFKDYVSAGPIADAIVDSTIDNGMRCKSCFLSVACEYFKEVERGNECPETSCTTTIFDFITSD